MMFDVLNDREETEATLADVDRIVDLAVRTLIGEILLLKARVAELEELNGIDPAQAELRGRP